jgi:hypothetical protein
MAPGRGERQQAAAITKQNAHKASDKDEASNSGDDEPLGTQRQSSRLRSHKEKTSSPMKQNALQKSPSNGSRSRTLLRDQQSPVNGERSKSPTPEANKGKRRYRNKDSESDQDDEYLPRNSLHEDNDDTSTTKSSTKKIQNSPLLDALEKVKKNVKNYCDPEHVREGKESDSGNPQIRRQRKQLTPTPSKMRKKKGTTPVSSEFKKQKKKNTSRSNLFDGKPRENDPSRKQSERRDSLTHARGHKKNKQSSSESEDSETNSNQRLEMYDNTNAQQVSDYTILECLMRQAIHDFSPLRPYKKTVMYWSTKNITSAAHMLVQRHLPELQDIIHRYGGERSCEMFFGKALRNLANNERAIQTRQIKHTFLSKQNPEYRLAENILETELDLDTFTPSRLHNNMAHIDSIDDLRELLMSPKMYQDQTLFDIFCLGLESGNFRQNKKRPFTPLDQLITKAHEAHFRVELYLALSKKSFRHHNTLSASQERIRLFNHSITVVREGRDKYLKKAVDNRMKARTERQVDECERLGDLDVEDDELVDIEEDDL